MNNPQNIILLALWLLMFSASSQLMIIAPILPQLGEQLNIPESVQGTLITAYAIMLGVFALIMGPISDKIGRRRILMLGSGSMAFALFLHSFAFDYYSMLVVRSLAGAAGGVLSGASVSYVGDYFPYEKRGWANGWISTGVAYTGYGYLSNTLLGGVSVLLMGILIWRHIAEPQLSPTSLAEAKFLHSRAES